MTLLYVCLCVCVWPLTIVEPEETAVAIQRLGKHVPAATNRKEELWTRCFTFTLLVSEGRAGEAWELSNKLCFFFLPTIFPELLVYIMRSSCCLWKAGD
jgi:hypothetical protein